jgi:hypothetical protein
MATNQTRDMRIGLVQLSSMICSTVSLTAIQTDLHSWLSLGTRSWETAKTSSFETADGDQLSLNNWTPQQTLAQQYQ